MSTPKSEFPSIDPNALATVAGGAARSSGSSSEISTAIAAIQTSISDLANQKNNNMDPMQMILMMMMMGGFGGGGGGGGYVSAPVGHGAPPVINVDTGVSGGGPIFGGCPRRGKKGW